jgi:hypothetical protein
MLEIPDESSAVCSLWREVILEEKNPPSACSEVIERNSRTQQVRKAGLRSARFFVA